MNYLYGSSATILILIGVEQYGEHRIQVKWDSDIEVRQTLLEKSKQDNQEALDASKAQYEKDRIAATSQAGRDAVNRFLRDHGLLPNGDRMPSSTGDSQAQGEQGTDGATKERGTGSEIERFSTGCGEDALKVIRWQDLCKANHCVIE
jgi:membrane protein involved in colicin uptake